MKVAIQLFTIYMLALSLTPCGDGGGSVVVIASQLFDIETQNSQEKEQNSDSSEDSPCSPFCICSNCIPVLDIPESEVVVPQEENRINSKATPSYCSPYLPLSRHSDIWHPPQLG
ncbi:MAG: hypothetical protein HKN68_11205 [Saprospiraceae bacterium]|nr:hypothetical protein [Saprospiraceae bacterium]